MHSINKKFQSTVRTKFRLAHLGKDGAHASCKSLDWSSTEPR